jgi:hypothetical protein
MPNLLASILLAATTTALLEATGARSWCELLESVSGPRTIWPSAGQRSNEWDCGAGPIPVGSQAASFRRPRSARWVYAAKSSSAWELPQLPFGSPARTVSSWRGRRIHVFWLTSTREDSVVPHSWAGIVGWLPLTWTAVLMLEITGVNQPGIQQIDTNGPPEQSWVAQDQIRWLAVSQWPNWCCCPASSVTPRPT